jgi:ribosomal subunit interface protein
MDVKISGRNVTVSDRLRDYVAERTEKVEKLADKPQTFEVKVTQQGHSKTAEGTMTVELTVVGRGPIIRAEATSADKVAAFDMAYGKLLERLRRAADRRKVHHGRHTPVAVHDVTSQLPPATTDRPLADQVAPTSALGDTEEAPDNVVPFESTPVLIRRKTFPATPMTIDDAVDAMELVGHDFYVFRDSETGQNSVVYRRRGTSYGVLSLDEGADESGQEETREYRAS